MTEFDLKTYLPEDFSDDSRVWMYTSDRMFTLSEAFELESMLETFLTSWKSHGAPVKGYANLFYGRFIIFIADETQTHVSGCSTDSSVQCIRDIESKFKVNMFNRLIVYFLIKNKVEQIPLQQVQYAIDNGLINRDTLLFNFQVFTLRELKENWIIPIKNSWLNTRIT